ncbi:MAG: hypothetical protein HOY78_02555 [Saccharothrix sp.]|nr:hypothetical protein [Saccharothrix sp.]
MDNEITTTPPVHHDGPDTAVREIVSEGPTTHTGVDSTLRAEFERIAVDLAAKHTKLAIVVPVRQLVDATVRVVADMPRIPDYDDVTARAQVWTETTDYSPTVVPDFDPATCGVHAQDTSVKVWMLGADGDGASLVMEPEQAEAFFLAGLAAVRHAASVRDRVAREREGRDGRLILPPGVTP